MTHDEQARNQNVTVRVTASEKRDVVLVASVRRTTESELLRTMSLEQITAEAERIRRIHEEAGLAS